MTIDFNKMNAESKNILTPATTTKSNAGRKPKPEKEKRTKAVSLNFTPTEYAKLESQAKKLYIPVGMYIQSIIRHQAGL